MQEAGAGSMPIENERKFLLESEAWRAGVISVLAIRQGYVAATPDRSVRVRIAGSQAWLTLKFGGPGPSREEYEYSIPEAEAEAMLAHTARQVVKERHIVPWENLVFEVDVFGGSLAGLVLAELEFRAGPPPVRLPDWIGREVTDDSRYYNAVLARDGLAVAGGR